MAYLTAVVTLFGLLSIVNLMLTLGVVRRLRTQRHGSSPAAKGDPFQGSGLSVGETVGRFSVSDTEGRPLTRDSLHEGMLVAFLSPGCLPCEELLPSVVELSRVAGPGQVLVAVVLDEDGEARPDAFVAALSPVATVAVTRLEGELTRAFAIEGMPTGVRMGPEGRIAASGRALLRVSHPTKAGA
ncbi:TlpA disulfide reductase family protein [Streptomyces sp. NPDC051907]|uniref:TlpA disulfide reductase family protein n=1 Tax=Streptomyces sp. NPDC051907 TaxID=3155284 RepID=UPI0034486619